ncbi:membrane protein of unknown function [Ralstonia solanacearum CMR15]|nr:membrane protein of unknown function [Ralstonia solanacearum CMR15]
MDVFTTLLVVIGVAFLAHVTLFATITLDEVRTGRLVAVGAVAVLSGALLMLLELPVALFVLFRRPGARLRVLASMTTGIVVFVGCYALADSWIVHKLPPRRASTPVVGAQLLPLPKTAPRGGFSLLGICQASRKIRSEGALQNARRRSTDIAPKVKKGLQALTCKPFHILVGRA